MAKSLLEQYEAYKKKRQAEEEQAKQQAQKPVYDIPSTGTFAERYEAYKQQRVADERSASMRNNVNSPHQNPLQLANRRSDAIAQGTKRRQEDAARAAKEEETTRAKQADKQLHLDTVDRLTKQYMPSKGFEETVFKLLDIDRPEEKEPDPIPQVDINKKYGPESELPKRGAAIASAGASDAPFGFGKIIDLSGDGGSMSVRNSAMDEADRERMEQAERDRKDQTARDELDARIAKEQRARLEREHTAALAKLYSGTLSSEEYAAQEALAGELADRLNGDDKRVDDANKPQNKPVNGWDYDANKAQDARRVELEDELARMYQMTSYGRGGSIDGGKTALETADRERLEFAQRDMQGNEDREALIERTKPTYKDLSIEELQTKRGEAIADIAQYDKVLEWAPSPQNVEAYRNYIAAKVQKQAAEQAIQQIDQGIQGKQDIQLVEKLKSDYSKATDPFEKAEIDAALKAAEFKRDWNAMSPADRAGTWVYDRIKRGFYQFNQAYYGFTTDWIFDVLGIKRLDVSTFNQKQLEEVQTAIEKQAKNTSWITDKAGDIVTMAVQNIPSIIFGLAGGAGSAASSTAAMVNAGSSLLGKVSKAAFDMLKNPHFLNSLFGSIGRGYIEEHDVKGNDILTSLVNSTMKAIPESMIEVGGGIETAPMKPRGLVTAVETAAEEGLEEIFQKGSSGIYDYSQSGKGENTTLKDVISWDNPESIIPIKQTIEEGLMGAAGGGVMGGAQQLVLKGVDAAANANQERNMNTTMGRIVESNAGPKAVADFVIANLDAQSKSAELAAKMGAKPSIGDIGRLTRTAREELTEKIYAAANFDEQMALIGQAKQLDELALGVVQQEQAAMESAMEAAQRERIEQQDREVRDNKAYEIVKNELQGAGEIGGALQQEVDAAPEKTGDILLAYELGKLGLPKDKLMSIKGMMNIGEETAGRVYGLGSQAWEAALPGKTKKAEQTRAQMPRAGEGNVSFDESVNKDVWNAAQRKQVEHDSAVAQILGLDVTFYQSSPNEEGHFTDVEGIYRAADGSIRIDINAGRRTQVLDDQGKIDWEQSKGDALMTLTMGHELTHHLIETNPELGREYIGVVMSELLDKSQDIQALIDGKVKRAAANKRTIGIEEAINEVVADGSEGILADEAVMQKVARQHPGLFTRIKDWILSYTKKLRDAISGMELLRTESKALGDAGKGLIRYSERITELYSRMMSADLAARSAEKPAVSVKVREASPAVEAKKEAPKTVKDSASDKAPDWAGNGITAGSADTVFTAENEEISFRYAVLPYDRLVTSMNTDMSINDAYPKELQPRDTERSASEDLVLDISRNLNFKRASSSGEVNSGAPLVGPDMVVEVGNHRAVGIMKAIESGGKAAQRYTQALKDGAAEFGIDPADISDKSVLVRVRESGVDSRRRLAMDGNAPVTNAYSDTESAATDAAKIKPGLLDMAEMGSGDIDTAANAKFVARFVSEVVPKTERGRMVDSEGKLSRTGEARIRNALFQLAYGDGYLTEQLAEATDTESRNMIKAMTAIAPRLASMNADMKRGLLHDLDVGGEIAESYRTVLRQKLAGVSVEAYLAQTTMLEDVPAAQRLLLEMFVENKRSAVKMTEALDSILDALEAQGDPRQAGMFGADMKPTAEGVISEGLRNFRQGLEERVAASERYSLRELPDGTKYVFVDSDQDMFDSVSEDRYAHVARRYIIDHFSGKVIGDTNRAFVQLDSANEYAYPAKKNMDQAAREAKLRAAPELPNIVEAGTFVGHSEDDGRHPEAVRGWDYYQVIYQVADRIFEGKTSIKKIERGDVFYNVTNIRDITTSFAAKYGKNPKYRDQSNASVQSIPAADSDSQDRFSERDYAPPLYSKMAQEIEAYKGDKMGADSVVKYLTGRGVKADEIRWSGIVPFLQGKKSVSKDELLEFAKASALRVEDATLGGESKAYVEAKSEYDNYATQFQLYLRDFLNDTPDHAKLFMKSHGAPYEYMEIADAMLLGYNVKEFDNVLPDEAHEMLKKAREAGKRVGELSKGKSVANAKFRKYTLGGGDNYRELLFTAPDLSGNFQSSHWPGEKNVLAHTRLQDFQTPDGKPVLFVEEVQSDWHEKGREQGYSDSRINKIQAEIGQLEAELETLNKKMFTEILTADERDRRDNLPGIIEDARTELRDVLWSGVPEAPFSTTWHEYVLKRVLRMAAEGGYDYVGWTTGKMQADRYRLAKYISSIEAEILDNGEYYIISRDKDGEALDINEYYANEQEIARMFGKEIARQIVQEVSKKGLSSIDALRETAIKNGADPAKVDEAIAYHLKNIKNEAQDDATFNRLLENWNYLEKYSPDMDINDVFYGVKDTNVTIQADDFAVGGEGMKAFYDIGGKSSQNIPRFLNKYGAQWGAKISTIDMRGSENTYQVSAIEVTEAMKKSVLFEGQVMYSERDSDNTPLTPEQIEYFKNSKVRDEDGKLLIVYHGTDANFNVFDKTKSRANMDIQGNFFSPWEDDAAGYGRNVRKFYLNITNPATESIGYKALRKFQGQNNAGAKARDYLIQLGYDGVDNGGEEYIAFDSAQVKSVTNQTPTSSPDIRYSERQRDLLSKREVLAGAFDQVAQSDGEKRQLNEYKKLIRSLNRFEREASELRTLNTEERRKKGEMDKNLIASRAAQISEIEERIDAADRRLLRMQNAAPLRNILKRESDRIYTRAQEQKKEKLDQWRQAREDNAEHTSLVNSISKTVTAMQKWINEPNTKTGNYVPDMMVMPLGKMLEGIDIQSKRALNGGDRTSADKAFLSGMDAMYSTLEGYSKDLNKEDGSVSFYLDLPSNMLEAMNGLIASMKELVETGGPQGYIINQMSNEQLSVLEETLTTLRTAIRTINATHVNSVFEHVNEAAEDNISEVEGLRKKGRNSQVMKFFNWLNATPVYAFERMGKAARSFFEAMQDGADKLAYHVKNEVDFAKSAFSGKEVRDWNDEVKTFNVKGKQLQIPVSTMMSIYLLSKRNQAMGHIMGAGIRIANFKQGAQTIQQKGVVVNDTALLEQIEAALTDRQKDVANALQRRMSTVGARLGNEVSMKRFGTRMFTEPNYFPIEVDNTELSNPKDDDSGRKSTMFSLLNMSATKQLTKKANNRLVARDVFTVYADHMSDMARYNAMALPILDMIKWYNYRNVQKDETGRVTDIRSTKGAFLDSFGDGANTYIRRMLENANGADKQSSADRIGNKFLGKYNRAVIAANLRVALLQPTAYMKAAMVINPLSMGSGLIKSVAQLKANIAEMEANSGIAQWKQMGFYDLNVSNTVQELIKRDEGVIEKFGEKAMWLPGFMDRITWASLWQATKDDVSRKMPELKGDAFMDQVKKSFRDMVYRTQVVDSVLTRSEFMRQSSFAAKSFSSFMSEGTQAYNLAMNAVHKLTDEVNRGTNIAGAWKKHGGTVARTVATYTTVAAVTALVEAISDAYRDDDELKPFLEKVQEAYAGNLFNNLLPINIPIVSDMIEAGKRLAKELGADTYGFSETSALTAGFDYLTDFVKQFKSWQEKQGDGGYQVYGWTYKILQSLSTFTGVPMANLSREIVTAWNAFAKVADPGKVIKTYERKGDAYDALYKAIEMQDEERRQKALKLLEERGDTQKEIDKGYWDARSRATGEKKYETWVSGIRTGDNLRKIMEDYMAHGVTAQTLGGEITGSFREEYVGLVNSGRISEAAALKGRLLNAYVLLGYKRDDKNKDIDKWVVEEAKKNKK